jgi:aminobenzoyl-glutamate transport protein
MRAVREAKAETARAPKRAVLDTIERIGNSVPHPVVIFLILIAITIIASHLLYLLNASVSYQVINLTTHGTDAVTTRANSLLTSEGIRHIYTQLVPNFMGFSAVGLLISTWSSRRPSPHGLFSRRCSCRCSCSWPSIRRLCWRLTGSETDQ